MDPSLGNCFALKDRVGSRAKSMALAQKLADRARELDFVSGQPAIVFDSDSLNPESIDSKRPYKHFHQGAQG
jgi:hypothetical protein